MEAGASLGLVHEATSMTAAAHGERDLRFRACTRTPNQKKRREEEKKRKNQIRMGGKNTCTTQKGGRYLQYR